MRTWLYLAMPHIRYESNRIMQHASLNFECTEVSALEALPVGENTSVHTAPHGARAALVLRSRSASIHCRNRITREVDKSICKVIPHHIRRF